MGVIHQPSKGQGATEYLVLMSVVLGITLICIAILVWPTGSSKDVKQSQKDINFGIGKIAYPELAQGLVVYYKFDEGVGDAAYNSAAPNSNDSTLVNGTGWVSGVRGKAVSFDMVDDYATFSPGSSTTCTFAVWINPGVQAAPNIPGNIVGGGGNGNELSFTFNAGTISIYDNVAWRSGGSVTAGTWSHVAFTYDGSSKDLRMYKNGAQTYYGTSSTITACDPNRLGAHPGGVQFLNGSLDDMHYYKRILSASEIELLYKNPGYP